MGPHDFTLYDMMANAAQRNPAAPALIAGTRRLSFGEFLIRVDALAAGLAALGLSWGDRLCIVAQNDPAYVEVYGACARQGILAYPVNWRLTAEEVARIVERAQPKALLVDAASLPLVVGLRGGKGIKHWLVMGTEELDGMVPLANLYVSGPGVPRPEVDPDDAFAAISTAAVDVIPRGAVLTHRNLLTAGVSTIAAMGLSERDPYLLALPLFHITALGSCLSHLHAGAPCVIVNRFDAAEAVQLIDTHHITHVSDFPPVLTSILDAAEKAGSRLESLTHVSGLDRPETIDRLHRLTRAHFWTGFGQSETSGFVTLQRYQDHPGAAGKVAPLARVRIVDDYDREVPTGTAGEICVRGPLVFRGYYEQPEVNAYTFRQGWHHTGDVGRMDAAGYLYYVKRKPEKELIKPGGENVYPSEVEGVIMELPHVTGVSVIGVPDLQWGEAIKAVVETNAPLNAASVADHVASRIARFKKPKHVVFTRTLPRTPEGGIDREAVKAQYGKGD